MTASKRNTDIVVTPADWEHQAQRLTKTATNLWNLVGWYGSTHNAAMWRKEDEFLHIFEEADVAGFDPQVTGDWQASFAQVEAEVMATASVITIRLENNELLNGSLGSIAETGLALTSAALRGQIVIISIEDGLLASLDEPGAVAQYMMLEMSLEQLQKVDVVTPFLRIHRGDNLQELAKLACETAQQQARACRSPLDYNLFLTKKAKRSQHYPLRVLLGGSGGPYTSAYVDNFQKKQNLLAAPYLAAGHMVKILSEGTLARAWDSVYENPDLNKVALTIRNLLSKEFEAKQEADILLLPIMAESASKAAATETGFLLLYALTAGQELKIFLEPFDPVDYVRQQLKAVDVKDCADEKSVREILLKAGMADTTLAAAMQAEILEAGSILKALTAGDPLTFKQIKQSLLRQTPAFGNADNIRRVRFLVQAHLEKFNTDERFPGFFSYSDHIA